MLRFFSILIIVFINQFQLSAKHKVYIIHGYGSSKVMMRKLTQSIKNGNFETENYGYRSVRCDLDSLAKKLHFKIKAENLDSVSFVTHSMGGLLVRAMLKYVNQNENFPLIHRFVMIAPPNKGAQIADFGSSMEVMKYFLGPNVEKMRTNEESYANQLPIPSPKTDIGIIAGIRNKYFGYNFFISGDNDGLLSPDKTNLGIEKDFIAIKSNHNSLLRKKKVCELSLNFLENGCFTP